MRTKILMIEDLELAQLAAIDILDQLDCSCVIAENGAEALDFIITSNFDMVFVDIELPDINGFEISTTVRSLERKNKHIPIIAVTAYPFENFEMKCKASGFDDYLLKPITLETARHIISKYNHIAANPQGSGSPFKLPA